MQNTDSDKKSFFGKTVDAVGNVFGFAYDVITDVVTLPLNVVFDSASLMREDSAVVKAKDYYHNKDINDNRIVVLQKDKFMRVTYKSLKVAEGAVSDNGREGLWFDYEYSDGKELYRTVKAEYKKGKKNGSYHEKKVIDKDVYITTGTYKNDKKNGTFESSKNGAVYERTLYENDEPVETYQYDDNGKLVNVYKNNVVDNNMSREAPTSSLEKNNAENKADSHLRLTLSENGATSVSDSASHSVQPLTNGRDSSGLA